MPFLPRAPLLLSREGGPREKEERLDPPSLGPTAVGEPGAGPPWTSLKGRGLRGPIREKGPPASQAGPL
jgi:hypothetical protein